MTDSGNSAQVTPCDQVHHHHHHHHLYTSGTGQPGSECSPSTFQYTRCSTLTASCSTHAKQADSIGKEFGLVNPAVGTGKRHICMRGCGQSWCIPRQHPPNQSQFPYLSQLMSSMARALLLVVRAIVPPTNAWCTRFFTSRQKLRASGVYRCRQVECSAHCARSFLAGRGLRQQWSEVEARMPGLYVALRSICLLKTFHSYFGATARRGCASPAMAPPGEGASPAVGGPTLGDALIPVINKLQDIFSQVGH
jgi:hypothetical protein